MRLLLLCLLVALTANAETLRVGKLDRTYLLFAPSGLPAGKVPLVVVLHDRDSSALAMARLTRLHELGAKEKFIVAYPEGLDKLWVDGRQKFDRETQMLKQDDVDFLGDLVKNLIKTQPVDPARVYVVGYSNGAMMALRMAVERPDLFAAVGAVGGSLPERVDAPVSKPVSLMLINGTVDPMVPDSGGPVQAGVELGRVLSSEATARRFATSNGCAEPPEKETPVPGVLVSHWQKGRQDSEVVLARVSDWGHAWPTGFDASAMLWEFLKRAHR